MRKNQHLTAALAGLLLLLSAGCAKALEPVEETEPAAVTEPAESVTEESSLESLRQTMAGTPQLFAVAYFGYREAQDPGLSVDPIAVLQESAPELCAQMPFLTRIPADRIIGQNGDLFCIVPLDPDATVAVNKGYWDSENQQHIYDDMLYSSSTGDPILLLCNNSGWEPDCQLYISGPSGDLFWYPQTDELEPMGQFINKPDNAPAPTEMIGSWELAWTEVEGYLTDEEQGTVWIEIFSAASGGLLMNYTTRDFPHKNFYNEPMTIDQRELHFNCGNREWVADLDFVGPFDTTYALTLREDGVLIKQNYFLLDGAPSVSYEYFCPVAETAESSYEYARSQGWQPPDLSELADTFWLSQWCGYALELNDSSHPGDTAGLAAIYSVDEIGAYTRSHSGSWNYEDGMLHLCLIPETGSGQPIDEYFPVLVLDGALRICRTEDGTGLPYFYSDTLMDTLEQPMG